MMRMNVLIPPDAGGIDPAAPFMRDFNDLYFFAAVVKHEGFSAAARALGLPKSRISRHVALLEEQLGVRLIERSTRRLSITAVGRDVYRYAQTVVDAADAVDEVALRMKSEPQGLIRIGCPVGVQRALAPKLPELFAKYPRLRAQFLITNRPINLIEEQVDVAIRIRENLDTDGEMPMRKIGISRRILVASPALLKEHGLPKTAGDLVQLPILDATETPGPRTWELSGQRGQKASVMVEPKVSAGDFTILIQAAQAGIGVALLPELECQGALHDRKLVRVLPDWSAKDGIIHLVFPSRRGMLPGVRAMIDFLATALKAQV
jgi:DNA-binding transcriptional LysR family regulator